MQQDNRQLRERLATLEHQLAWFKRQLFGAKSERRLLESPPGQMSLGEGWAASGEGAEPPRQTR